VWRGVGIGLNARSHRCEWARLRAAIVVGLDCQLLGHVLEDHCIVDVELLCIDELQLECVFEAIINLGSR